ncbi:MAG: LicD family protein [Helicobacter sp.]|nr:LicD family protein [Helicobacter sp.]
MLWQQILPPPIPKGAIVHERSQNALFDIKKYLDSLGVPFCLAHGTLLGIYRDGDLLPGDSDVDVMLPWSVDRLWLAGELARLGCTITTSPQELRGHSGQWGMGIMMPPHDSVVELSFLKPENGKVWFGFTRGQHVIRLPVSPFGFTSVPYLGIPFPIPHPCDRHLSEIYGESWNVRTRNRNFFIINPNIVDEGHVRVAYSFNHILGGILKGNYKKAQGYTEQLLSVYDDPLLYRLRTYFASVPNITLFDPLPWQSERLHYREVMGG